MKCVLFILLVVWHLTLAATAPQQVLVGCLAGNYNISSFPVAVQAAVDYMTKTSSSTSPTDEDYKRNATVLSFFKTPVEITLRCYETGSVANAESLATALFQQGAVAIVGDSTSTSSVAISAVATMFRKPVISYAATSSALSNKEIHPFFMRSVPPDATQAMFIIEFLFRYKLQRIVTLGTTDSYGTFGLRELKRIGSIKGVSVELETLYDSNNASALHETLLSIAALNVTTIVAFIERTRDIELLLEAASTRNLLQQPYIWVFSESLGNLFKSSVTSKQTTLNSAYLSSLNMQRAADSLLFVKYLESLWPRDVFFESEMAGSLRTPFDQYAFDAMLTVGWALSRIVQSHGDMSNLHQLMKKATFLGASGRVRYDENGDRLGTLFSMAQWRMEKNKLMSIANFSIEDGFTKISNSFTTPGGGKYSTLDSDLIISSAGANQWRPILSYPPPRYLPTFGVHSSSGNLVMFGGFDLLNAFNDMWFYSFQSQIWSMIFPTSPVSPLPRYDAAYTIIGDELIVYGGFDTSRRLKDVWKFNINTREWDEVSFSKLEQHPGARAGARMASFGKYSVMFGGVKATDECANDAWIFDSEIEKWKLLTTTGVAPSPRKNTCVQAYEHSLLVYGGLDCIEQKQSDGLFRLDLLTNEWSKIAQYNQPTERDDMRCAVVDNKLYVSGGWNSGVMLSLNDMVFADLGNIYKGSVSWTVVSSDMEHHSPRDSTHMAVFENRLLWFGGWPNNEAPINDMWSYGVKSQELTKVHNSAAVIDGRIHSCYTSVGKYIYLFGGKTQKMAESAALYAYNTDTSTWETINPSTDTTPAARVGCTLVSSGGNLFLFGGWKSSTNEYLADNWVFNIFQREWTRLDRSDIYPTPRAFHAATKFSNESIFVFFGGRDAAHMLTDMWLYDIDTNSWKSVPTNSDGPNHNVYGTLLMMTDLEMIFYGGINLSDEPTMDFFTFQFANRTWSSYGMRDEMHHIGKPAIAKVSDSSFVIFGGSLFQENLNSMLYVEKGKIRVMDTSTTFEQPIARSSAAMFYIGNKLIALNGMGSFYGSVTFSNLVLLPDVWEYSLYPVCSEDVEVDLIQLESPRGIGRCANCSAGTYEHFGRCIFCPQGTFNDAVGSKCRECRPGFFNPIVGAAAESYCLPCPVGSYNDKQGAGKCLACPAGKYCPIGCSEPLDSNYSEVSTPIKKQSLPLESNARLTVVTTAGAYASAAFISAILIIIFMSIALKVKPFSKVLRRLDLLYEKRHQYKYGPIISKQTRCGGLFSVVTLFFLMALFISTFYAFFTDNTEETRSLLPNLSLYPPRVIKSEMTMNLEATGYIQSCEGTSSIFKRDSSNTLYVTTCSENVILEMSGIENTGKQPVGMTCKRSQRAYSCQITVTCKACSITAASGQFKIAFEDQSYVNQYQYKYETSTGVINKVEQYSSIEASIKPLPNKIFRGQKVATCTILRAFQTIFSYSARALDNTGYHVDLDSYIAGEQVSIYDFNQRQGVAFCFQLQKEPLSLEVIHTDKKDVFNLVIGLLGSTVGVVSAIGMAMRVAENLFEEKFMVYLKKLKKHSRKTTLQQEVEKVRTEADRHNFTDITLGPRPFLHTPSRLGSSRRIEPAPAPAAVSPAAHEEEKPNVFSVVAYAVGKALSQLEGPIL